MKYSTVYLLVSAYLLWVQLINYELKTDSKDAYTDTGTDCVIEIKRSRLYTHFYDNFRPISTNGGSDYQRGAIALLKSDELMHYASIINFTFAAGEFLSQLTILVFLQKLDFSEEDEALNVFGIGVYVLTMGLIFEVYPEALFSISIYSFRSDFSHKFKNRF